MNPIYLKNKVVSILVSYNNHSKNLNPKFIRVRICCKHVCRSCYKQDEMATYGTNMCPRPCACHMTSQITLNHSYNLNHSLSLPTQVKQNPYHLSLYHLTLLYLSKSLHHRLDMLTSSKITVKNNKTIFF